MPLRDVPNDSPGELARYGWSPDLDQLISESTYRLGRVVRVDGPGCLVATPHGIEAARVLDRTLRAVSGDWVGLEFTSLGLVVAAILPRHGQISRTDPSDSSEQILAVNVDQVLIVHGFDRPVRRARIERTVAIAHDSGARPLLVLNKIDLAEERTDPMDVEGAVSVMARAAPGVGVVPVSAASGEGVHILDAHIEPGATIAVIGESGAGKSSLINRLAGEEVAGTGRTKVGDQKGRHTTTARELFPLRRGVVLMDTPGLRAIALTESTTGVDKTFPEIVELAAQCHFRNCSHETEPGCAVSASVEEGLVQADRVEGYRKLQRELKREQRRAEVRRRHAAARSSKRRYERRTRVRLDEEG